MKKYGWIGFIIFAFVISGCSVETKCQSGQQEHRICISWSSSCVSCQDEVQTDAKNKIAENPSLNPPTAAPLNPPSEQPAGDKTADSVENKTEDVQELQDWPSAEPPDKNLTKDEIKAVARRTFPDIRTCSRTSKKKGKMIVSYVIDEKGLVNDIKILSEQFKDTDVAKCIIDVVRGMRFRATNKKTPITYPYLIE